MPFNANGVYQRLFNWREDRDNGIEIRADRMDQETDGIVQGLNDILQGNVDLQGPIKTVKGTAANPAFSFSEHTGTGFFRKPDGSIGLAVDGTEIGAFPASFFTGIKDHHRATNNPHNVTAAQIGAIPATDYSNFAQTTRNINAGNGLTGGGSLASDVSINADYASQSEAENGTNNSKLLTPLRAKQLFLSEIGEPGKKANRSLDNLTSAGQSVIKTLAANAEQLGGLDPSAFLRAAAQAVDSAKLGGLDPASYLLASGITRHDHGNTEGSIRLFDQFEVKWGGDVNKDHPNATDAEFHHSFPVRFQNKCVAVLVNGTQSSLDGDKGRFADVFFYPLRKYTSGFYYHISAQAHSSVTPKGLTYIALGY